jgi:hypothetical protein
MRDSEKSDSTVVTIDALAKTPGRATLFVQYGEGKRARIELPSGKSGFSEEQAREIYRRDLQELMDALYQWILSRGDIFWPTKDGK